MLKALVIAVLCSVPPQAGAEYAQQEELRVAKYKKILASNPTDPEAALQVGKFLCFVKGAWDEGLPILAVSKDQVIVKLAMTDLGTEQPDTGKSSPLTGAIVEYGGEVALELVKGDQWWSEAKNHQGAVEKINIYNRAAYWYRRAVTKVDDARKKKLYARINAHTRAMGSIEIKIASTPLFTDTGVEVIEGQLIKVSAKGSWGYDAVHDKCDWKGYHNPVPGQPLPNDIGFFCLTAKVGESGKQYPCYKENPHTSDAAGHLFLGPNSWAPGGPGEMIVSIELTLPY